jgi:NCS1 family nucleobase:cation symporter-1
VGPAPRRAHAHYSILTYLGSRHLFTVKSIVAPTAGITFFIWCIVKAKGVGPVIRQPSTLHGSELGWAMVASLMSCISNMATLVTYVLHSL